jgi:uncharacterized repeat protein (TIGR01451 family)
VVTHTWSGLSLASGQRVSFTVSGTIDPTATGSLINNVLVLPPSGTSDPNMPNNSASDTDTLTPQADLAVAVSDGKTIVVPGSSDTYTITVTNNGPSTVSSLTLTDTVPAALLNATFGSPSAGSYDVATGVWSGLSLASGGAVTLTLTGTIDPNAAGTLTNTVTVAPPAGTTDPTPANNTDTDTDRTPAADLSVTVTDGKTTVAPGDIDTYTIAVTNNGPDTLSSLTLIEAVALSSPIFGLPSAGRYNPLTGAWMGLSLATGQTASLTLSGAVTASATGSLTNIVAVAPPAGTSDTNPANNAARDTDTVTLVISPNPSPPPATSANMILRRADGLYAIYDIGNNAILAGYPLVQVGTDWRFAGLGGFQAGDTSDMLLRNASTGGFRVYDISNSNNNITNTAFLGSVGLDWQVMGFGNFSSRGETDMILRNANTGAVEVYDISNNQITGANLLGSVGLDWQFSGVGNFSGAGESDLLLRNANTGGLEVYDIANNQIANAAFIGTVGLDWQFSGVGNFSGIAGETDLLLRNVNTGALEVYDINNNQLTNAAFLGTVGLDWQFAGVAPIRGPGTSDLVLRNVTTGVFEAYNIANNQIIGAASLGKVGLEWQVGGFAANPAPASMGSSGSVSLLAQAMAAFGGGSEAGDSLNAAPLGADTSQQPLLTAPQHA